jgi:hypothetical protein
MASPGRLRHLKPPLPRLLKWQPGQGNRHSPMCRPRTGLMRRCKNSRRLAFSKAIRPVSIRHPWWLLLPRCQPRRRKKLPLATVKASHESPVGNETRPNGLWPSGKTKPARPSQGRAGFVVSDFVVSNIATRECLKVRLLRRRFARFRVEPRH